jgi:hypothetical protein
MNQLEIFSTSPALQKIIDCYLKIDNNLFSSEINFFRGKNLSTGFESIISTTFKSPNFISDNETELIDFNTSSYESKFFLKPYYLRPKLEDIYPNYPEIKAARENFFKEFKEVLSVNFYQCLSVYAEVNEAIKSISKADMKILMLKLNTEHKSIKSKFNFSSKAFYNTTGIETEIPDCAFNEATLKEFASLFDTIFKYNRVEPNFKVSAVSKNFPNILPLLKSFREINDSTYYGFMNNDNFSYGPLETEMNVGKDFIEFLKLIMLEGTSKEKIHSIYDSNFKPEIKNILNYFALQHIHLKEEYLEDNILNMIDLCVTIFERQMKYADFFRNLASEILNKIQSMSSGHTNSISSYSNIIERLEKYSKICGATIVKIYQMRSRVSENHWPLVTAEQKQNALYDAQMLRVEAVSEFLASQPLLLFVHFGLLHFSPVQNENKMHVSLGPNALSHFVLSQAFDFNSRKPILV